MRAVLVLLWFLSKCPPRFVEALGRFIGGLLFHWGRRRVTLINLEKCFPDMPQAEREAIGRGVFQNLARAALELGRLWYAPKDQAISHVKLVNRHYVDDLRGKTPIILLAPHFVGLDIGGARVSAEYPDTFSMYSEQKNKVFDAALRRARQRFGEPLLFTRKQGLRPVLRALKENKPFYYLPDMDFGAKDAAFVDFFKIKTATVTALSRLCEITGAKVVPCVTRQHETGYDVVLYPPFVDFPSGDLERDARTMNAFLEERILEMKDQYFWVHKRFKTRPPGEESFYKK